MTTAGPSTASNACAFCRKRKRSCDRLFPKCSTCTSEHGSSGPPLLRSTRQTPSFPTVYFLDHQVFRYGDVQIPKVNFTILPFIIENIGDPQTVARLYLERVHWWMPIISKKRLHDHVINPLASPGAETPLLLLAMKILMWKPSEQLHSADSKTPVYIAVKHACMEAATAGVLTLQLLQTQILLAIYELGHAIYPAAYLSVGQCARYGLALGVDKSIEMGMLARMCQAAYLLGRVHRYNMNLPNDEPDHQAEKWQLDRTLRSLLNLTYVEGQIRRMAVCAQTGICYSALIALYDPGSSRADPEHARFAMDLLKPVADSMSWDSEIFLSGTLVSVEDASPLLLYWAYQAATIYSRLLGRYGSEALQPLGRMKDKLQIMSHRWRAGGTYPI
ncbi:hypothetical protein AOQ84DRAFT_340229 [Glonium stellatum]|uniref:Zn(2)-C6 fungal-type domain-containing protein n=1 Tax=Glonium stellatum TaxID=574774 RepID=A0A8E2F139_9PEZI|nr:hypothetical protein AOQ84DRAFT_340229 [Glonium stellatum]